MLKKIFTVILAVNILILFSFSGASGAEKAPYTVGAVFSVTGGASFLGEPERNTVKMVEEWVNAAGGINGHPLQIIIEDTKTDPSQAVLAVRKLLEKDKVIAIVGPSTSGESMAVVPIME